MHSQNAKWRGLAGQNCVPGVPAWQRGQSPTVEFTGAFDSATATCATPGWACEGRRRGGGRGRKVVGVVGEGGRGAVSGSRFKENRVRHGIRSGGNPSASREDFSEEQTETGDTVYTASPVPWRSGLLEVH